MSDLIEKLKRPTAWSTLDTAKLMLQAADEIERLRHKLTTCCDHEVAWTNAQHEITWQHALESDDRFTRLVEEGEGTN